MTAVSPYSVSLALVMMGVLVLAAFAVGVLRARRRTTRTLRACVGHLGDRAGLVRARSAALRMTLARRVSAGKRQNRGSERTRNID